MLHTPFESINEVTNEFEGFDVDLMKEVANRIGLEVKFVNVAWEGIIPGLWPTSTTSSHLP